MKTQSSNHKFVLGGKFHHAPKEGEQPELGIVALAKQVRRISRRQRQLEQFTRKQNQAILLMADYHNGSECHYGFSKAEIRSRVTVDAKPNKILQEVQH